MNSKFSSQNNQRIQVFARCRPLNSIERKQGSPSVVDVLPEKNKICLKDKNNSKEFSFDKVFTPNAKQIDIYKAVVEPLIKEVLMGYNCTVFAYGQTGTGKTYTMEGERTSEQCSWEKDPAAGIIPRSLHQLFDALCNEKNVEFNVRVSFLELYNEEIFDLLSSTECSKLDRLYEDPKRKGSVVVKDLEEKNVCNKDEVYAILEKGTAKRQTAATMLNASSSRSHTIFSVTVHIKENTVDGEELLKIGKLNLVDLAGSENIGRSGADEKRAREAGNINKSLLALGKVITSLIEKQPHVPYRESKLTRLLQDSLGGHTKTSIIATISPALCNFDETISTLDYATKAKCITINPEVNQKMTKRALIREYTEEIERLRKDLAAARNNAGFYVDKENYEHMQKTAIEDRAKIISLEEELELAIEKLKKAVEQTGSLTDEIDKVMKQHNETAQKLEEKSEELSNTKDALNYTQGVLTKTSYDRDEKQHIITEQRIAVKKLRSVTEELSVAAMDADKLQDKLDRKKSVEEVNEEQSRYFKMDLQHQLAEISDVMTGGQELGVQSLQSVKNAVDNIIHYLLEYQQKLTASIENISSHQRSKWCDELSRAKGRNDSQKQWAEELLQKMNSKKDKLLSEQTAFLSEKLPHDFSELDVGISGGFNRFLSMFGQLRKEMTQFTSAIEIKMAKAEDSFTRLSEKLDSLHETFDAASHEHKKHVEFTLRQCNEREKKLEILKNLVNSYEEDLRKDNESLLQFGNIGTTFENSTAEFGLAKETFKELIPAHKEIKTEFHELSVNLSVMGPKPEEVSPIVRAVTEKRDTLFADVAGIIEHSQQVENENFKELESEFEIRNKILSQHILDTECRVNTITESLSKLEEDAKNDLQKYVESLTNDAVRVKDLSSDAQEEQEANTSEMKKKILKIDSDVEKFISEDLVKDIPTGITPMRKTYPKDLPVVPSPNTIAQEFRSKTAMDIELAMVLPLDCSFNESEESKSSTVGETGSGGNSHNASYTSDDCESTGCESECLSNASSVSDISECGRNKENSQKSKNPSRLPKRKIPSLKSKNKSKTFLKPTAPVRKPLYSSNSDVNSAL